MYVHIYIYVYMYVCMYVYTCIVMRSFSMLVYACAVGRA